MSEELRPIGGVSPGFAGDYRFPDGSVVWQAELGERYWQAMNPAGLNIGYCYLIPQHAAEDLARHGYGPAYIDEPGDLDGVRPTPRALADRARTAAETASGPTAALIRELLGEVERLKADLDRLKGWPVAVKTAKDEAIAELTAEVDRLKAELYAVRNDPTVID